MTNPKSKKKIIVGYIGSSVGAKDLFKWRSKGEDEYFEGKLLDRKYGISKEKLQEHWLTVKITIEVSD